MADSFSKAAWVQEVSAVMAAVRREIKDTAGVSPKMTLLPKELATGKAVVSFKFPFRPDGSKNELINCTKEIWSKARREHPDLWTYRRWVSGVSVSKLADNEFANRMRLKRADAKQDDEEEAYEA